MPAALTLEDQQRAVLAQLSRDEADRAVLYARSMRTRAEMSRLWDTADGPESFALLELAGTARIGQIRAGNQLSDARRLTELFTSTLELLASGVMFTETAVLLLQLTVNCTEAVQVELERRVLDQIATANTSDARRIITAAIPEVEADIDAELTRERQERALQRRTVWANHTADGVTQITGEIDTVRAHRWVLDFEELVRAQKIADRKNGVVRTQAQRRADVFAELPSRLRALIQMIQQGKTTELLAQHDPELDEQLESPAAMIPTATTDRLARLTVEQLTIELLSQPIRDPRVLNIHIPMSTVLDLDQRSGYLEGVGPVPAQQCRLLLPVAGLRRLYVDHASGTPLGLDPTTAPALTRAEQLTQATPSQRYALAGAVRLQLLGMLRPASLADKTEPHHDPSTRLTRQLEVRDIRCIGIGCSQPASRCHRDHETRYPDGPTAIWNLSAKSARCHHAKHTGWAVERAPTGQITWTSPLGHTYTRPGVWQPPPPLTDDLTLPSPQLTPYDDHDPNPDNSPLWEEPPTPTTLRHRNWNDEPAL
jgi:hypothetical protein